MTAKEFVKTYYPFALEVEKETGISAIFIIAQAALESGWGKKAIGFNFFGIKFRGKGKFTRALTLENSVDEFAFHDIDVVSKKQQANGMWTFRVFQLFQDYDSPKEAFAAHAEVLKHPRYNSAWKVRHDPVAFGYEVWKCGYATALNYGKAIEDVILSVKRRL